jgi:hypothetical protein
MYLDEQLTNSFVEILWKLNNKTKLWVWQTYIKHRTAKGNEDTVMSVKRIYWGSICWREHFVQFCQQAITPRKPEVAGWRMSLSLLCNDLRNSSELRLPWQLASNTWKIMSTTLSVKSTPQTYKAKSRKMNQKTDLIFVNNRKMSAINKRAS